MTGVLAAVLVGFLVFAVIAWRDRGQPRRSGPLRRGAWLPLAVATAIFVVVDGNLLVTSLRDLRGFVDVARVEREPGAVRVEINAQRWVWSARYAGIDGLFATDDDVVTTGDVRAPVGRPVIVQLASSDVVHSLFVPQFRVKLDAVPGRIGTIWFRPVETGVFEIACTQHCGVHHYLMRGVVTVMAGDAFDRWVAAGSRDALAIAAEDARARAEEPTRETPPGVDPAADPAAGRRWGWPWRDAGAP